MSGPAAPALPPALAIWGDLFAAMPEPHRALLAGLVAAVAPAVERAEAAGLRPRGEVDSYSGVGTRGGIERLLGSEWLWRDLAPDDFLRRVAEREALTFEPVHRPAADARAVLVALDAGPAMLGRPRLVAFAALLCLAAAARARGAPLLWWCCALPDGGWREAFTRADVAALLEHVSAEPLGAEALRRRFDAPPPGRRGGPPPALWVVGPEDAPAPPGAGRVTVAEVPRLDPDLVIAARVEVAAPGGRAHSATFDLPGEAASTALLRDPFRAAPPPGRPRRPAARPGWAQSGMAVADESYLLVAMRDGILVLCAGEDVCLCRVPLAPFERLLGVDVNLDRLSIAVLTRYTARARVILREAALGQKVPTLRDVFTVYIEPDHPLAAAPWPRGALPPLGRPGERERFWAMAPDAEAFVISAEGAQPYAPLSSGRVLAACPNAVLVERRSGELAACRRTDGRTFARFPAPSSIAMATAFDVLQHGDEVWLAMGRSDGSWRLARRGHPPDQIPSEIDGQRVIGFVPDVGETPSAVTVDKDGDYHLRDADLDEILGAVAVEESAPDLVLACRGGGGETWLATAHRDAEGFAALLSFGPFRSPFHEQYSVKKLSETAACLRA